jgi:hypothetical protein
MKYRLSGVQPIIYEALHVRDCIMYIQRLIFKHCWRGEYPVRLGTTQISEDISCSCKEKRSSTVVIVGAFSVFVRSRFIKFFQFRYVTLQYILISVNVFELHGSNSYSCACASWIWSFQGRYLYSGPRERWDGARASHKFGVSTPLRKTI